MKQPKQTHEEHGQNDPTEAMRITKAARHMVDIIPHNFDGTDEPYTVFIPTLEIPNQGALSRQDIVLELKKSIPLFTESAPFVDGFASIMMSLQGQDLLSIFRSNSYRKKLIDYFGKDIPSEFLGTLSIIDSILNYGTTEHSYSKAEIIVKCGQRQSYSVDRDGQHTDGFFDDTFHNEGSASTIHSIGMVRFVLSSGPGTLLFPGAKPKDINVLGPVEGQIINALGTRLNGDELEDADAQQVLPGAVVGFDVSRCIWHQAPERTIDDITIYITLWNPTVTRD